MIQRLIEAGLRNRLLFFVLSLLLMGAGLWGYRQLPVDAFPDVSPNLCQVFTVTEGLAPEEVEQYVTYPIEAAMNGLPGVVRIRSVSNFGLSVVNVYFDDAMDIYFTRQLVAERLQEARDQIPEGFGEPQMGPISTGMGLILFYYLEDTQGRHSLEELRTLQDWVVKLQLQTVPGVTEVLGIGGQEKQYHVVVDPQALLRYHVTLREVLERIEANNLNVGAQFLEQDAEELIVRSVGLAEGIPDLESIVIKAQEGTPIYLSDLARVEIGGAIRRGVQTRNGTEEVVAGMVVKLHGSNASTVIRRVEERLAEINRTLPDGVRIVPYYEQKELVGAAVRTVQTALLQGILLVALVLLVFLGGLRPSLVVAASLPFSVLFAFGCMYLLGISANLMSLGGLAIAIGMMVDGTIVIVENVERHLREDRRGEGRLRLVARACREVGRPVAFAITIIGVVFLPLFTLQGVEGKTFRPLASTVALGMAGSLLFALAVAPLLSSVIMTPSRGGAARPEPWQQRLALPLYRPLVQGFVHRPGLALLLSLLLLALGAWAWPRLGSEFTPKLNEGTVVARLTMAPSISLTESTRVTQIVERRLMEVAEVEGVVTRIGRGEVGAHTDPINSAEVFVLLAPPEEWRRPRDQAALEQALREAVGTPPGVFVNFTQPIAMTVDELLEGVRAELAVKLFGEDLDVLRTRAEELAAVVREVPGAADVQVDMVSGTPQLLIRVERKAIARYGLNVSDVQDVIQAAVGGREAGQILEGVRRFDILVRYEAAARSSPEAIAEILVETPGGARVPLAELTSIEEVVGPRQITRQDNQRFITVQCNVRGRDIGSFVAEAQEAIRREVSLPPGYRVTWGGQFRLQQEANRRLALVVPVTLLVIFLLLYTAFTSLRASLLILWNVPLALVGGVIALFLSGQNLSVPASVGFIALFGIALENGMVLVTSINQLVEGGASAREAAVRGACLRLRPVLMTAVTTALGLLPLLFSHGTGSEVQRPLATVVVGGLFSATVLTLLVIPALYPAFVPRHLLGRGARADLDRSVSE